MGPEAQNKFLANLDVAATEAFYVTATASVRRSTKAHIEQALLNATRKFLTQLGIKELAVANDSFTVADWIDFNKCDSDSGAPNDESSSSNVQPGIAHSSAANIIMFDEFTGTRLTSEANYGEAQTQPASETTAAALPWREWFSFNTVGAVEADRASAVAVLHGLHEAFDVTRYPIDLVVDKAANCLVKQVRVVATSMIEPQGVWLPACVPKQSKVLEATENPNAVKIDVVALRTAVGAANSLDGHVLRCKSFYVVPEFKYPTLVGPNSAVSDSMKDTLSVDGKWLFQDGGPDTMHPFWAVRRLTTQQLDREKAHVEAGCWAPRFNCEIIWKEVTSVGVFVMVQTENRTKKVSVPFLTVRDEVQTGEELILQVEPKPTKEKRKRTWRDIAKE